MIDTPFVRKLALSFPDAAEAPHFEKTSFRFKKKIFATVAEKTQRAVLKLSLTDQSVFCDYDDKIFFPVPNAWGKKGWTIVEMKKVRKDMFKDALKLAYEEVAVGR
jgi:predicted DNA-binding protein (MmcQ/YjbR family)